MLLLDCGWFCIRLFILLLGCCLWWFDDWWFACSRLVVSLVLRLVDLFVGLFALIWFCCLGLLFGLVVLCGFGVCLLVCW